MSGGKQLVYRVYVHDKDGVVHGYGPGGDVPKWAKDLITNPKAWGEDSDAPSPAPEPPAPPAGGDSGQGDGGSDGEGGNEDPAAKYADLKAPDLKAEIARRNEGREDDDVIEPDGKKNADLIAALVADDAAQAAE